MWMYLSCFVDEFYDTVFFSINWLLWKVVFTSEQIQKFEQDILDGKDVTLEDYLTDQTKNYNNRISKFGNYLSVTIGDYVKQGLENTFEAIEKWIEE